MNAFPIVQNRSLSTPWGDVVGSSLAWQGGQYCAILTARGVVGCGIFDLACADDFDMAFAIARGTPQQPLREPEDLLPARIVAVSRKGAEMGISPGMTGWEAIERLMVADSGSAGAD